MQTVLIAGGTGLIGKRLSLLLEQKGYKVLHLSRNRNINARFPAYAWDLNKGTIEAEAIEQAAYVINLAGAGIADKRWTKTRKKIIIDSRVKSNQLLQQYFTTVKKPKAYISSAAIGIYGDRGSTLLREDSPIGEQGFLVESCVQWENAIQKLAQITRIRTVWIRIGIVLSTRGGALEKMLLPFKAKVGTYFGDGSAVYSWIHLDDICGIFIKALEDKEMEGAYNGVAPNALSNKALILAIGEALGGKHLLLPAPAIGLRLAMGEMADVVLSSSRVSSEKIEQAGYRFQFADINSALKDILEKGI